MSDNLRILAEGSRVDHGIPRVVVHVGDRRKVDVNPQRPRLLSDDAPGLLGKSGIAGGAKRHRPWKLRASGDAHADAELEVGSVQKRHCRQLLQPVERRRRGVRLAQA